MLGLGQDPDRSLERNKTHTGNIFLRLICSPYCFAVCFLHLTVFLLNTTIENNITH